MGLGGRGLREGKGKREKGKRAFGEGLGGRLQWVEGKGRGKSGKGSRGSSGAAWGGGGGGGRGESFGKSGEKKLSARRKIEGEKG